jgi:hypothetical protein
MTDVAGFRTRYPEFTIELFPEPITTSILEESKTLLSVEKCGAKYEMLVFLLLAHELQLTTIKNNDAGVEVSRSIEGGGRSIKNVATNDYQLYYSKTSYGQKFLAMKKTIRFIGVVLD